MNLEYSGREQIPAAPEAVWAFIIDPANIAACMPDVIETRIVGARAFDVVVQIAVGPVHGKFTFHVVLDPRPGGERMNVKIGGGGFGSVLDLVAAANLARNGNGTVLTWNGTATMRGRVAAAGGHVIDAQAKRVISAMFAGVKSKLTPPTIDIR